MNNFQSGTTRPIAAKCEEARKTQGTGAAALTAANGKKCRPKTNCRISDAVWSRLMAYCWITFKFDDISGRDSHPVDLLSEGAQSWLRNWTLHQKAPRGTEMEVRRAQDPAEAEEATPQKPWRVEAGSVSTWIDDGRGTSGDDRSRSSAVRRVMDIDADVAGLIPAGAMKRLGFTIRVRRDRCLKLWPARSETNHHLTPVTCRRRGT